MQKIGFNQPFIAFLIIL